MHTTSAPKRTSNLVSSLVTSQSSTQSSHTSAHGGKQVLVDEISSIGPKGIVGSREVKKKKPLIIPLQNDNFDAPSHPSDSKRDNSNGHDVGEEEEEQQPQKEERKDPYEGVYGLISTTSDKGSRTAPSKAPLLARSRPKGWREIEDEEAKLKYELEARPEYDVSSFERVPIEQFGEAMLLGMGWKPGVNDGAKVVELARRPERLGLGATAQAPPMGSKSSSGPQNRSNKVDPRFSASSKFLADGTKVTIIAGDHEGMGGRIRRLSSDEKEYIVELDNDEHVRVKLKEVEAYSDKKRLSNVSLPAPHLPPAKRYQSAEILDDGRPTQAQRDDRREHREAKLWVTPFIRVKVQSKRFRDGKYYCKKGVVEDIVSGTRCAITLDDGHVIDDIDQADLETVIPGVGGRVMVVRGPNTGTRGVIREKDSSKEVVYVQIDEELDVVKFSMDDVAEYVA